MLRHLFALGDEVSTAGWRLEVTRYRLSRQVDRTKASCKRRISRPDALAASAALGALYGLWTTRRDRKPKDESRAEGHSSLPIPGWLVRTIVSMLVTRLISQTEAGEADVNHEASGGWRLEP